VLDTLSWPWIGVMLIVPPLVGVVVAFPLWRKSEIIFGNIAGTAVIFAAAFALILREAAQLDRLTRSCLDAGFVCSPQPSAFARHAIYASIAMIEVVALFTLSLTVEKRISNRNYAPEWRS
jgi:uncharacterized protein YfaQ (DUF2300 family)